MKKTFCDLCEGQMLDKSPYGAGRRIAGKTVCGEMPRLYKPSGEEDTPLDVCLSCVADYYSSFDLRPRPTPPEDINAKRYRVLRGLQVSDGALVVIRSAHRPVGVECVFGGNLDNALDNIIKSTPHA